MGPHASTTNVIAFFVAAGVLSRAAFAQQCNSGYRTKFFNIPGPLPGGIGPQNRRLQELSDEVTENGSFTTSDGGIYPISNYYEGETTIIFDPFNDPFNAGVGSENFVGNAVASVLIPPGTWTLRVFSDDGRVARMDGITFDKCYADTGSDPNELCQTGQGPTTEIGYIGGTGGTNSAGVFTVNKPTTTTLTLNYFEGGSNQFWEVKILPGDSEGTTGDFEFLVDGQDEWRVLTCPLVTYDCSLKWWRRAFKLFKCQKIAKKAGGLCEVCPNDHWYHY